MVVEDPTDAAADDVVGVADAVVDVAAGLGLIHTHSLEVRNVTHAQASTERTNDLRIVTGRFSKCACRMKRTSMLRDALTLRSHTVRLHALLEQRRTW